MEEIVPIGIVDVLWDYDDYDETKKAYYELLIKNKKGTFKFINSYAFLDGNLCIEKEYTESANLNICILDKTNNIMKLQICGDIIYMSTKQYSMLNEKITKLQMKYNFDLNLNQKINLYNK